MLSFFYWCNVTPTIDGTLYVIGCQSRDTITGRAFSTTYEASETQIASDLWPQKLLAICAELRARLEGDQQEIAA